MLPLPLEVIDGISLDQEVQLLREDFVDEWRPIDALWNNYVERASFGQILPGEIWNPPRDWKLTALSLQFILAEIYQGNMSVHEAIGHYHHLGFKTAQEMRGKV